MAGRAGPLLGFSCSRFPSRPAAQGDAIAAAQPPGEGQDSEVGKPHQPGRCAEGAGEGGAAGGAYPLPRSPAPPPANLRGAPRATGSPAPPAPLTALRRPLLFLPSASRSQGPGRGGGVHKVGCSQIQIFPVFPRQDNAKQALLHSLSRSRLGRTWGILGEARFKPVRPVVNY